MRAGEGHPKGCRYHGVRGLLLGGQMEKTGELLSSELFHCISRLFFSLSWCQITVYVQNSASSSANLFSLSVGAFGSWVPVSVLHFGSYCCHISNFYFYFSR